MGHAGLAHRGGACVAATAFATQATAPTVDTTRTLSEQVRDVDDASSLGELMNVPVRNEVIAAISADPMPPTATQGTLGLAGVGETLMPGPIDAPVHPLMSTIPVPTPMNTDPRYVTVRTARAAQDAVMRGRTSAREHGRPTFGHKRGIDAGVSVGPRFWPSGATLSRFSGHGDDRAVHDLPGANGALADLLPVGGKPLDAITLIAHPEQTTVIMTELRATPEPPSPIRR